MSRVTVRIRPASLQDVPGLIALLRTGELSAGQFSGRALLDDSDEHLSERLIQILDDAVRHVLVAVDEVGGIVGLLASCVDDVGTIDLTPVMHVTHLIVTPSHRRRGVGRALLAAAVHLADERGIDRVLATASAGSREANRYLARLGFAPLVVHRIASTSVLRRSLGLADAPDRMAVLRRARLLRAQRARTPRRAVSGGA